jgi:hypothetical protein
VDPGTACWVGRLGPVPVLGVASCELFGRAGALELLLERVLAGEPLDRRLVRQLACGGLLTPHDDLPDHPTDARAGAQSSRQGVP